MLKLRKILLCNYPFYIILILSLIYIFISINMITYKSKHNTSDNEFSCIIKAVNAKEKSIKLDLFCKEKIIGTIYYKDKKEVLTFLKEYRLGDKVSITGTLKRPLKNTIPNLFNYQEYLYHNKVFYLLNIEKIDLVKKNKNIFYMIKNYLLIKADSCKDTGPYLRAFVLGDVSNIGDEVKVSYQINSISHLLAVSGMQISIFAVLILGFLKKLKFKEKKRYYICLVFVIFYLFLTNGSPSILRASIFFLLLAINKIYYFNIKAINLFILTLSISLFYNPFLIYNLGFLYSFTISFYLILFSEFLNSKNYLISLIKVSILSFLVSIPINIYNNFSLNILGVIYNLFFVPLVNIIIFPLSLITLVVPFIQGILSFFISILESTSLFLSKISFGSFIFCKPSLLIIIIYYIVITFIIYMLGKRKYYPCFYLLIFLIIHNNYNYFIKSTYLIMLDVGQGDSVLIYSNNHSILIDTGGNYNYNVTNNTILMLKSLGIKKLDYLFLTHGDYDHMGDSINLINKFRVERVYFNSNEFNKLESSLIEVLNNKKNSYKKLSSLERFELGYIKITSLGENLVDENSSSLVLYVNIFNNKLLLMGDASIKTEEIILNKYNLGNIDILKIGHHGSKTSSKEDFINNINPKYSLISVGKNNNYGHPSTEILDNLSNSTVYRTDQDGSIVFKFKNDKLETETYVP